MKFLCSKTEWFIYFVLVALSFLFPRIKDDYIPLFCVLFCALSVGMLIFSGLLLVLKICLVSVLNYYVYSKKSYREFIEATQKEGAKRDLYEPLLGIDSRITETIGMCLASVLLFLFAIFSFMSVFGYVAIIYLFFVSDKIIRTTININGNIGRLIEQFQFEYDEEKRLLRKGEIK